MFRKRYRRVHQRSSSQRGAFSFLRQPAVQLSILGIAALAVILIVLTAGK
jgi:hypothetical protein